MRQFRSLSTISLAAILGCRSPGPSTTERGTGDVAKSTLAAVLPELVDHRARLVCGHSQPPPEPRRLLLVTVRQCLSCRSVGLLLRRLVSEGAGLALLVPSKDAEEICTFARRERIEAPIFTIPDRSFPIRAMHDKFLYGMVNERGEVIVARFATDAYDILADSGGGVAHRATGAAPR